jgi:hypothetical protein
MKLVSVKKMEQLKLAINIINVNIAIPNASIPFMKKRYQEMVRCKNK